MANTRDSTHGWAILSPRPRAEGSAIARRGAHAPFLARPTSEPWRSAFIVGTFLDARANLSDVFLLPDPLPRIGFAVECIHDSRLAVILGDLDITRWAVLSRYDSICDPHLRPLGDSVHVRQ